ncbi:major facilitator superfamily domain-containing protein [Achaetomium macrosporum]|uniref:Major facilitator superfamily domain-containing protein n=1 Tax=Achaetomium macrosporum TaxID=79813 RepID=A0AAN7C295_9PEZI|nr:major facilitator superfamily domain-containing protein [Achaetomium macrosporum]
MDTHPADRWAPRWTAPPFTPDSPVSSSSSSSTFPYAEEKGLEVDDPKSDEWTRGVGFWRCFIGLCIPILLSAFEGSVVSTALPTISRSLKLGPSSSWVATAFLLASIVFQPLYGQLADIWGRRHLMMVAVVVFGVGSAVAGYANSCAVLVLGRIVQGMGSGGIDLFAELILCDIIPLKKRGHYVAIKAAVYALGTTVGPLLGGVFAQTNWRWCFGINLPICIIALVLMWFWLQLNSGESWKGQSVLQQMGRVDYVGLILLTTSVVLILCALSLAGTVYAWSDATIVAALAGGSSGIVVFIFWERCRRCAHPIMAPHVFSNRTTIAALIVTTVHGFITYGFQFYLPPFFQAVLGASPAQSGVLILPCSLTIVILAAVGGPLLARFGKYRLMHRAGFVLMIAGLLPCITFETSRAVWLWILLSFLVGVGSGIIVSTTLPTVLVELTDKENAAATGSWAFLRGLGSLLGVAIPNAVFNAEFSATLHSIQDAVAKGQLSNGQAYEHASATFISGFGEQVREQILAAFAASFKLAWIIFLALAILGFLATLLERQVRLRRDLDSDFGLRDSR